MNDKMNNEREIKKKENRLIMVLVSFAVIVALVVFFLLPPASSLPPPPPPPSEKENFLEYTEYDPGGFLTVSMNRVLVDGMDSGAGTSGQGVPVTYLRKQVSSFTEYTHIYKIRVTNYDVGGFALLDLVCNDPDTVTMQDARDNVDGIGTWFYVTTSHPWISMRKFDGGNINDEGIFSTYFELNTDYWIEQGVSGTTAYIKIFYDEARTQIYKQGGKDLGSSYSFKYILPICSRDGSGGQQKIWLTLEDLMIK